MPSLETLTYPLVLSAALTISLGLMYGIHALAGYLRGKTKNQFVGYILSVVETLSSKVVAETYQAYVSPLKASGSFDRESQKIAADKALAALKAYLGPDGLGKVAGVLGAGANTDDFLRTFLESAVVDSKPLLTPAAPPVPPLPPPAIDPPSPVVIPPQGPN